MPATAKINKSIAVATPRAKQTSAHVRGKTMSSSAPVASGRLVRSVPGAVLDLFEAQYSTAREQGKPLVFKIDPAKFAAKPKVQSLDLETAMSRARERGQLRVAEILNDESMLSANEFANFVGTTRATVNSWRHAGKVLGLEGATRGFRFPQWQVGRDGKPFGALPKLLEILDGDTWAVYRFLVQHQPALDGETGLAALRHCDEQDVLDAAEGVTAGDFA